MTSIAKVVIERGLFTVMEPQRTPPEFIDSYRRMLTSAIEAGLMTLPKGVTIEDVVNGTEWAPVGTMSLVRPDDRPEVMRFHKRHGFIMGEVDRT